MRTYGLIGKVLGHSWSKEWFTEKFRKEGIDAQYLNFEIPSISCLPELIEANPSLRGFNVTIPYKTEIIPYLSAISAEAKAIGAVNVVKIDPETHELTGYNTDVTGFDESIAPHILPCHQHAFILGTGGVSKAVAYAFRQAGMKYTFVSRHKKLGCITYDDLRELFKILPSGEGWQRVLTQNPPIIVNCTPLGMYPDTDSCPDIPYHLLTEQNLLFDCVYNPTETLFLRKGAAQGAITVGGLEMLHLQAQHAWEIWNDQS